MSEDLTGRVLGKSYRLERRIGEGGMGAVYEATALTLGRRVAVKVLLFESDPKQKARFEQEALATARLSSPNIVAVTDFRAEPGEPPFLVMELLEGESLRDRMKRSPRMPVADAARIATELLGALAVAHDAGVVHRDVKPPNVFLVKPPAGDRELVKLLDFGIAKVAPDLAKIQTTKGTLMGTPVYFAPEQLLGAELDGRTDVHAVGAMLFEMLAGRRPFDEKNPVDLTAAILHAAPPPLAELRPDVPPEVAAAVADALAKERALRPTARELAARLAPFGGGAAVRSPPPPPPPRRPRVMLAPAAPARSSRAPWFAVAVVAAFAGAAAAFLRNGEAPSPVHDEVEDAAAAAIATEPEASTAAAINPPDAAGERDDARAEDEDDARRTRLYKARVAALRGDAGAVRELLHATVMDGGAVPEEARLLREACKVLGDRPCAAAVREMYPPEGD